MANVLPTAKRLAILAGLVEGNSIRAIERMTGVHRDTILRPGVAVGGPDAGSDGARARTRRGVGLHREEAEARQPDDPAEYGDVYQYVGLGASSKAIVSWRIGKRNDGTTMEFLRDLRARVLGRPQITTDGFRPSSVAAYVLTICA